MNTASHDDIITMVERWIRHELPIVNRSTEAHGDVQFLIVRFQLRAEAIAHASHDVHDPRTALKLLQLLAFGVSSVERHLQLAGGVPGDGVAALHAGPTLLHLGEIAGHPPRDSHYTYWLHNHGDTPLTFTGSTQESMFIRIVNEMHHLHAVSAAALRPLCAGDVPVASRMAVEAIEFAAHNHDRLTSLFQSFLAPSLEHHPKSDLQFELFAMTMRTYLGEYPVGIETFLGPDPSNMPGQMEIDLSIGTVDDAYRAIIHHRLPHLLFHDRDLVEAAMQRPSLALRLAEAAGLTEHDLLHMAEHRVAEHIALQPWLHGALKAFAHLTKAAQTSAAHFAFIHNHLRPSSDVVRARSLSNAVTLEQHHERAPGEMSHLVELRGSHPTVHRLVASLHP